MDHNEFDNDKSIEPSQLDVEAVRQPDVFFKWAERSVQAKHELERLEFQVEVLEAKLQLRCRDNPSQFGLGTITEAGVKAAVRIHPELISLVGKTMEARRVSSLLTQAVSAMEQKKRMIEVLVTLHGQEYFAGPAVPHDLKALWLEYNKRLTEGTDTKLREKARRRVRKEA